MLIVCKLGIGQYYLGEMQCSDYYFLKVELGPLSSEYSGEVYVVWYSESSFDTFFVGNKPLYIDGYDIYQDFATVHVKPKDSSQFYLLTLFDYNRRDTFHLLDGLACNTSNPLFTESDSGIITMRPPILNSIVALRERSFLQISYLKRKRCSQPIHLPYRPYYKKDDLKSEVEYGQQMTDFLFGHSWLVPRD